MKLEPVPIHSRAAKLAFAGLAVAWSVAGWWIVVAGDLHLSLDRRSRFPVLIDGASAVLMAFIFLFLGLLAAAVLLQSLSARRGAYLSLLLIDLVLPLAYLLLF